jgi:hypothetical protein
MDTNGGGPAHQHLLFAWSPSGWELRELNGEAPAVGTELTDNGHELTVIKVGPSPLPADPRLCAYTSGKY